MHSQAVLMPIKRLHVFDQQMERTLRDIFGQFENILVLLFPRSHPFSSHITLPIIQRGFSKFQTADMGQRLAELLTSREKCKRN